MATNGYLICEFPVFYATSEGQTRLIAERLAAVLHEHGFESRAIDLAGPDATHVDWTRVRGTIVGASLHVGRHQKAADRFVRAHVADLNYAPSAFFSVSLSAASKNAAEVAEAERIAREFTETRGWKPAIVASLAGRLAYSKYNFLIRFVMKRIAKKEGGPTDTSRDHELTDWDAVDKLAHDMAAEVHARAAA
jgi:menaquinone-dependent protoporphyrinogen oxidase